MGWIKHIFPYKNKDLITVIIDNSFNEPLDPTKILDWKLVETYITAYNNWIKSYYFNKLNHTMEYAMIRYYPEKVHTYLTNLLNEKLHCEFDDVMYTLRYYKKTNLLINIFDDYYRRRYPHS